MRNTKVKKEDWRANHHWHSFFPTSGNHKMSTLIGADRVTSRSLTPCAFPYRNTWLSWPRTWTPTGGWFDYTPQSGFASWTFIGFSVLTTPAARVSFGSETIRVRFRLASNKITCITKYHVGDPITPQYIETLYAFSLEFDVQLLCYFSFHLNRVSPRYYNTYFKKKRIGC